jgi:hypothetical protein
VKENNQKNSRRRGVYMIPTAPAYLLVYLLCPDAYALSSGRKGFSRAALGQACVQEEESGKKGE